MPYEKTNTKLYALMDQALKDPNDDELRKGADEANVEASDLVAEITRDAENEIWGIVSTEITEYNHTEKSLHDGEAEIVSRFKKVNRPEHGTDEWEPALGCVVPSVSLSVIGYVVFFLIKGWSSGLRSLSYGKGFWITAVTITIVIASFAILLVFNRRRKAQERRYLTWKENVGKAEEELSLPLMRARLIDLAKQIDQTLLEKKIKPKLREVLNRSLEPSYDTEFCVIGASGLAEVFDPSHAIDTTARQRLKFMLENIPGGSIGIAGPRGAGKSTLILSYCGPKPVVEKLSKPTSLPILSILASAPVEYQARDFILYLFSAVCHRVLDRLGEPFDQSELQEVEQSQEPRKIVVIRGFRFIPEGAFALGVILIIAGFVMAGLFANYPEKTKVDVVRNQSAQSVAPDPSSSTQVDAASNSDASVTAPVGVRFLRALEIKPILLIQLGFVSCLLGAAALAFRRINRVRIRGIEIRADSREKWVKDHDPNNREPQPITPKESKEQQERQTLVRESRRWLRKIKFQQSYTSGWSGSLKLPVGLEGGVNSAVTLAENQLSLPEIIHNFTSFISHLSLHYQVIIGIDELDKLESDDKAQRFLNEIKSIFGLERCFYLISVSESAMSSFERRGLPFRDVFDSSFDSIIYVDYLNFSGAKRLLSERVIGRPIPFFALSYCLSGGLARDIIRTFRMLLEFSESIGADGAPSSKGLSILCQSLVKEDLKAKIRALSLPVKKLRIEPEGGEFLERAYRLDVEPLTSEHLRSVVPSLVALPSEIHIRTEDNDEPKYQQLNALQQELAIYCCYLITVLDFFGDNLTRAALKKAEHPGAGLDQLARARQTIAVDPNISKKILDQFREEESLQPLPALPKMPEVAVLSPNGGEGTSPKSSPN